MKKPIKYGNIFLRVQIYFLYYITANYLFCLTSTKPSTLMDVCPICLDPLPLSIFTNTVCGHVWCKCCHDKMIVHNHSKCPLCRKNIVLKRRPPKKKYIEWLLEGGEPVIRWRRKRSDKYFNRYYKYEVKVLRRTHAK